MPKQKIDKFVFKLIRNPQKWMIYKRVVFKYDCKSGFGEEDFYLTKRKKEKYRVQIGVINYIGISGFTTFKDIFINLGIRKVGIIGTGEISEFKRIQCPHCKKINKLFNTFQICENCGKKFYLYDNKY